jgi:hypothetical protein
VLYFSPTWGICPKARPCSQAKCILEEVAVRIGLRAALFAFAVFLLVCTASGARAQEVCDGVTTTCSLEDLGSGRYKMTLVTTNNSSGKNVVFKWSLNAPFAPSEWETVSFVVPPDWSGGHPGHHLSFQTPNGDFRPNRIYSPTGVADCGGVNSLVFEWTFDNVGGPTPECTAGPLDYTYHMQGLGDDCANLGQSFVCPGVVPVEDTTWGKIKNAYGK